MLRLAPWLFILLCDASAGVSLHKYLPSDVRYAADVPTPASVLGFELGEWHVRHDQLVRYMEVLAAASPRIALEVIGRTHELRPLLTLVVTHEDNQASLDTVRQRHLDDGDDAPLVLWFGYSIHGNEASGSNAALMFAYYLAAAQGQAIEDLLKDTVILIDPSLNPDGLGRFAQWANSHRAQYPIADRDNREHQEVWPGGRFNHYWFDLNRDWLLLTHPESRARVATQQKWRPQVVTDFHEMGSDSTYFFQPGVPERRNPLTPEKNVELTARLGEFHAQALDEVGQLYFTEERFDDYYYGKGSTYPDVQGSIGILFEQASARGHLMATEQGDLAFATAIRNQLLTSLSTLRGARALKSELQQYRRDFYREAQQEAQQDASAGFVFGDARDPERGRVLARIFLAHGIEVYELARAVERNGQRFEPGGAWLVPTRQRQYRLLTAMLERRREFQDSTFYDVSSWTFPLALDLPIIGLRRLENLQGGSFEQAPALPSKPAAGAYAYAFDWDHYAAPRALRRLLEAKIKARVATRPFTATTTSGDQRRFELGTIVVPGQEDEGKLQSLLQTIVDDDRVPVFGLASGLTSQGADLGSPSLPALSAVKPLLIVGTGVDAAEAGEVWHLLDTRLGLPPVMVDSHRVAQVELTDYSHVLMVHGNYASLPPAWVEALRQWIKGGGVLVTSKGAAAWATGAYLHEANRPNPDEANAEKKKPDVADPVAVARYGDYDKDFSKSVIGGVIVEASVDTSHPLAYGYRRDRLALFRNGTVFLEPAKNPYQTPLRYTEAPVLSGYLGADRLAQLKTSAAVVATKVGRGAVIRFADNPNFRGYWYGTNRLYFNALLLSQILKPTPLPEVDKQP